MDTESSQRTNVGMCDGTIALKNFRLSLLEQIRRIFTHDQTRSIDSVDD